MEYSEEKFKQLINKVPLKEYYDELCRLIEGGNGNYNIHSILEYTLRQIHMAGNAIENNTSFSYRDPITNNLIEISSEEAQAYVDDGILFHGIAIFYAKIHNIRVSFNMSKNLVNTLEKKLDVKQEPLPQASYVDKKSTALDKANTTIFYLEGWD